MRFHTDLIERDIGVEGDTHTPPGFPRFGGDQNSTIGCPCTVESGCVRAFQNRHLLNVVRVDPSDTISIINTSESGTRSLELLVVDRDPVNQDQWLIVTGNRADPPDKNAR